MLFDLYVGGDIHYKSYAFILPFNNYFSILRFFQGLGLDQLTRKYYFLSNSSLKIQIESEQKN